MAFPIQNLLSRAYLTFVTVLQMAKISQILLMQVNTSFQSKKKVLFERSQITGKNIYRKLIGGKFLKFAKI